MDPDSSKTLDELLEDHAMAVDQAPAVLDIGALYTTVFPTTENIPPAQNISADDLMNIEFSMDPAQLYADSEDSISNLTDELSYDKLLDNVFPTSGTKSGTLAAAPVQQTRLLDPGKNRRRQNKRPPGNTIVSYEEETQDRGEETIARAPAPRNVFPSPTNRNPSVPLPPVSSASPPSPPISSSSSSSDSTVETSDLDNRSKTPSWPEKSRPVSQNSGDNPFADTAQSTNNSTPSIPSALQKTSADPVPPFTANSQSSRRPVPTNQQPKQSLPPPRPVQTTSGPDNCEPLKVENAQLRERIRQLEERLRAQVSSNGQPAAPAAPASYNEERIRLLKRIEQQEAELAELRVSRVLDGNPYDPERVTNDAFEKRLAVELQKRVSAEKARLQLLSLQEVQKLQEEVARLRAQPTTPLAELDAKYTALQEDYAELKKQLSQAGQNAIALNRIASDKTAAEAGRRILELEKQLEDLQSTDAQKQIQKATLRVQELEKELAESSKRLQVARTAAKDDVARAESAIKNSLEKQLAELRVENRQLRESSSSQRTRELEEQIRTLKQENDIARRDLANVKRDGQVELEAKWASERARLTEAVAQLRLRLADAESATPKERITAYEKEIENCKVREKQARDETALVKRAFEQQLEAKWVDERAQYNKRIADQEKRIKDLVDALQQGPGSRLDATERQLEVARRENDALKRQVAQEKAEAERVASENARDQIDKLRAEVVSLRDKLLKVRSDTELQRLIGVLEEDARILKQEKSLLQRQLELCKETTRRDVQLEFDGSKRKLEEQIRALEDRLATKDVVELSRLLDVAQAESARLKKELELLKNTSRLDAAASQAEQRKKTIDRNVQLLEENIRLSENQLREEISQRDVVLGNYKQEVEQLKRQLSTTKAQLDAIRSSRDLLERGANADSNNLGDVAAGYAELLNAERAQTQFWKERASYADALRSEIERLKREKRTDDDCELKLRQTQLKLVEVQHDLESQKAGNIEELQTLKLANLKLKEEHAEAVSLLKRKLMELTSKLTNFQFGLTLPDDVDKLKKLTRRVEDLERENDGLKYDKEYEQRTSKTLKDDIVRLKDDIARLKGQLKESDADKLRTRVRALQKSLDDAEDTIRDKQKKLDDAAALLSNLSGKSTDEVRALLSPAQRDKNTTAGKIGELANVVLGNAPRAADKGSGLDLSVPSSDRVGVQLGAGGTSGFALKSLLLYTRALSRLNSALNVLRKQKAMLHADVLESFRLTLSASSETVTRTVATATRLYEISRTFLDADAGAPVEGASEMSRDAKNDALQYTRYARNVLVSATLNLSAAASDLNKYVVVHMPRQSAKVIFSSGTIFTEDTSSASDEYAVLQLRFVARALDVLIALACFDVRTSAEFETALAQYAVEGEPDTYLPFGGMNSSTKGKNVGFGALLIQHMSQLRRAGVPVFGLPPTRPGVDTTNVSAPPLFFKQLKNVYAMRKLVEVKNVCAALRDFYSTAPQTDNDAEMERFRRAQQVIAPLQEIFLILYDASACVSSLAAQYDPTTVSIYEVCEKVPFYRTVFVDCMIGLLICRMEIEKQTSGSVNNKRETGKRFMSDLNIDQYFPLGAAAVKIGEDTSSLYFDSE